MKKTIKEINWMQNIECNFTEYELEEFVKEGKLEKVEVNKEVFYIKKGTKSWFLSDAVIVTRKC